jgi:hypothetical protein
VLPVENRKRFGNNHCRDRLFVRVCLAPKEIDLALIIRDGD